MTTSATLTGLSKLHGWKGMALHLECPDSLLFVQYNKTMEGTDLAEVPRLVCQAESLGRLRSAKKYNLVLMDESESILMQLSSEKTMGDRAGLVTAVLKSFDSKLKVNFESLKWLVQTCRKLLAASKIHLTLLS